MTKHSLGWKDLQGTEDRKHDVRVQYLTQQIIRRSKRIEELKAEITTEVRLLRDDAKKVDTLTHARLRKAKQYAPHPS